MVSSTHWSGESFDTDMLLYYYHWVVTSAGRLLISDGIIRPF